MELSKDRANTLFMRK